MTFVAQRSEGTAYHVDGVYRRALPPKAVLAFSKVGSENTVINTLVPKIGPKTRKKKAANRSCGDCSDKDRIRELPKELHVGF